MTPTLTAPVLTEPEQAAYTLTRSTDLPTAEAELSLWLAALESFLRTENLPVADTANGQQGASRNWTGEVRIVGWGLLKCSQLATNLRVSEKFDVDSLAELQQILQETFALCESLSAQGKTNFTSWKAWCANLENELHKSAAIMRLLELYAETRHGQPPPALGWLSAHPQLQGIAGADVREIFGRLFGILERLRLIEKMLKQDQPLKPALLMFALLNREMRDLLVQTERAMKIMPPDAPLFEILDGFAYVTPMELRKVYEYELVGVGEMRQTPVIFARVENSCGLLKDCFQQAIVALVQVFSPDIQPPDIFPNQQNKLEDSLVLRRELWTLLKLAQKVEKSLDAQQLAKFNARLADFRENVMPFLMFKDVETTERFIEELTRTRRNEEIAQVLHRFGAYLETLLGQVNMRNVLAPHQFDYPEVSF